MKKIKIQTKSEEIEYQDPFKLYCSLTNNGNNISLLMESRSINLKYGRMSIIVPNPAIKITGKNENFMLKALNPLGREIIKCFSKDDFSYADEYEQSEDMIKGIAKAEDNPNAEEHEKIKQKNVSFVLRTILNKFDSESPYAGAYGAFAYDFAKSFYKTKDKFSNNPGNDFVLFMPSVVYRFNDIKEKAEKLEFIFNGIKAKDDSTKGFEFIKQGKKSSYDMDEKEYLEKVKKIKNDIKNGRVMQCVFSRKLSIALQKHPVDSYSELREINPSPYSFFYNLGDNEILYGASPERHITIENKEIEIRPIAGTVQRSKNPLEDAQARIKLLTDEKEIREHTMLVDLARHELYKLSEPKSVYVSDLYTIEQYPNLYHLVSGVKGKLKKGIDAVDALLITLPAGTLSGAPKLEAMKMIGEYENSRRGFYGGAIGYISFNGDCNTGITIRSIHVANNESNVRSGGGIVSLSSPENELAETKLKAEKMLKILGEKK